LEFQKATIQDIPKLDKLNQIGEQKWKNEFFSRLTPQSHVFFAQEKGKAVGVEGYIQFRMNYKGKQVITHRSERTKVALEYRGRGIFQPFGVH